MAFFNPEASLIIRRGKLPHWRQEGAIYFVTFRLADALPQAELEWLRREKELWFRLNPEPHTDSQQQEYHRRFTQRVDRWLDAATAGASWRGRIAKLSWNPALYTLTGCVMSSANLSLCLTMCTRSWHRSANIN
jgi:hypothetical protein